MNKIKFNPYSDLDKEKTKEEAGIILRHILACAEYFEYKFQNRPIIFMSTDVFEIIAAGFRETIIRYDLEDKITVCGYDAKQVYGKKVLYLGYDISAIFVHDERRMT